MDGAVSAGDAGFDAALKALDALEGPAVPQSASAAAPLGIAPIVAIEIEEGAEPASVDPALAVALETETTDAEALETAVNDSLAKFTIAPGPAEDAVAVARPAAPPVAHVPPVAVRPGRPWLLAVSIAGLGVFASLLSVVGLIVTARNVTGATLIVADARERQQQMAKVEQLVHDLELIRARQIELLQRQQTAAAAAPLSSDQFNKSMDNLRIDIGKRGPDAAVMQAVREAQVDTANRINELSMKVIRIESAVGGR